ncbi:hypothetical protein EMCG_03386 [[Emmonsia] crescens]|uniref:Uncharacterized protein n=1 Tax=[Emmonsia] crescens TaxID=73230 RepID=A0A0G2HVB0_9EURO|nr:hypothetical protein EMCG_03386 [Emmonsia crescens UAMH 3008]
MAPTNTPARQSNVLGRAPPSAGNGSLLRTPRFVFGSAAPSSSASQFAATPRFRFPDRGGQVSDIEADMSDVAPSSSTLTEAEGRTADLQHTHSRDDVIQDSNSDEEEILFQDDPNSSPLEGYAETSYDEGGFDIDAEIDSIFPPTPERRKAKRRRVLSPAPNNPNADPISSCPSGSSASASPSSSFPAKSPVSSLTSPTTPSRQAISPEPTTPLPSSNTAFNRLPSSSTKHPRFLLHHQSNSPSISTNFTQSSQAQPTTAPTSTQRRQPHFILPPNTSRPPEHGPNSQTIDQAFAIPGRPRRSTSTTTTTPNCIPGGMAASVRGWLLEAEAAKHASQFTDTQTETNTNAKGPRAIQMPPPVRAGTYRLVTEVVDVQHQTSGSTSGHSMYLAGHPAPVTLMTTTHVNTPPMAPASNTINAITNKTIPSTTRLQPPTQPIPRKFLLFGNPISTPSCSHGRSSSDTRDHHSPLSASSLAPPPTVAKGDKIGIRRGLVWEMEIEEFGGAVCSIRTNECRKAVDGFEDAAGNAVGTRAVGERVEKWVVGVEWDIL